MPLLFFFFFFWLEVVVICLRLTSQAKWVVSFHNMIRVNYSLLPKHVSVISRLELLGHEVPQENKEKGVKIILEVNPA